MKTEQMAFPSGLKGKCELAGGRYEGAHVPEYQANQEGMTLRDYFAAKAMQAYLTQSHDCTVSEIAHDAYRQADAMIDRRIVK